MRAYWINWGGIEAIYIAKTRARARYLAAKDIADAWMVEVGEALVELQCLRAPAFDGNPGNRPSGEGWLPYPAGARTLAQTH